MDDRSNKMIFVPMSRGHALALRAAGATDDDLRAFAATPRMVAAHGYRPEEDEDADFAAQLYASIAGLIDGRPEPADDHDDHRVTDADDPDSRLVISAEVPASRIAEAEVDADHGAIRVRGLEWPEVTAVFVDEPAAAEAVRRAREAITAAGDQRLAAVLELPAVRTLTDDHDLLWHVPEETW